MASKRHFLWEAYEALADRNDLTEPQGRQILKDTFPHLAEIVDYVISTKGDLRSAEAAQTAVRSQAMSSQIRDQIAALKGGNAGVVGSDQSGGAASAGKAGDMNAIIRGVAGRGKVNAG